MRLSIRYMQKHILTSWCFILLSSFSFRQVSEELKWSDLKDISVKLKQQQKPVLIDLYTNWCHWCKVMDKKTYGNPKVIDYLNSNFYVAKVNAETKDSLIWANKVFTFNNQYAVNDFALYVTNGQPGFPGTVILAGKNSDPVSISGFLEPKEIEPILKYFGEGAYLTKTFPEYKITFKSSW